jgi:GTP-binding protein
MQHFDDILRLGLGEAIPISALQGDGMADLALFIEQKKQIFEQHICPEGIAKANQETEDNATKPLQLALLGRQNVGKSTLFNKVLQDDRVLTGPIPGLTRDAIAVDWTWENHPVQLVDTAGIRKMTRRLDDSIEDMSVADALRAMKVAEVGVSF